MQRTLEELLLQLGLCDLDLDGLVDLLLVPALVIGIVLDGGREESVDEGSLAKTRLAGDLSRSWSEMRIAVVDGFNIALELTMIVKAAPLLATILCLWLGSYSGCESVKHGPGA